MTEETRLSQNVLIVDDNPDDRKVLRRYISRMKWSEWNLREATSVDDALHCIAEEVPDILIIDQLMGSKSGLELIQEVDEQDHPFAVIVVSGSHSADLHDLFGAGADDYIAKGELSEVILQRVLINGVVKARLRRSLAQSRRALDQQLEFEARLIAMVSHDLRTPLSSLVFAAEAVAEEELSETGQQVMEVMKRSASRVSSIVDQLLDLTRVRQTGSFPVEFAPADLGEVVENLLEDLRLGHPGRQLELELSGELRGVMDSSAISQMLSNLVSNALRYGAQAAPISIVVSGRTDDFELSVLNLGPTISAEALSTLFEAFVREPESAKLVKEGLGLGLFIVRSIAEAHGGTLRAASAHGETRFTARWPKTPHSPDE